MSPSGNWIATHTGKQWYLENPRPEDVCIEDIAHGLSHVCRFGGQCRTFYSVAEHSVRMAEAITLSHENVDPKLVMLALLHDATEAYLGDIVRPLKQLLPAYKIIEKRTEEAIMIGLGLAEIIPPTSAIKGWDDVLLMTERRDLVNHCNHDWTPRAMPLKEKINPWSSTRAKDVFLRLYNEWSNECKVPESEVTQ